MPGMRDQFAHFYAPDEDAIAAAMKTGLVVPDANVLLNLYRFQATARDQLFGALEKVSERLWIPYQVGLEFQRNRLTVMSEQEGYFAKTKDDLDKSIKGFGDNVQAFKRRLSLDESHVQEIKDALAGLGDLVADAISKARELNEVRLKDHATDAVLDRIDALFEDRVGGPMEPNELEEAREEAKRRIRDKIPPGYMDRKKDDPTGDYLIWRQTMTKAVKEKIPVVFVTDDTKEDWYQEFRGQTLGARRELREEMIREAGVPLLMMTTEAFLRHAKTYLDAEVSDATVDQASELPSAARVDELPVYLSLLPFTPDSISDRGVSDMLLERIAAGEIRDPTELSLTMHLLRTELGGSEMQQRVVQAVYAGKASGIEPVYTMAVMDALSRELRLEFQPLMFIDAADRNTADRNAALRIFPTPLSAFKRALEVSPVDDDPDTVAQARRHIRGFLDEPGRATARDRARAKAWMRRHDQRLNMQRSASQEEPPAED